MTPALGALALVVAALGLSPARALAVAAIGVACGVATVTLAGAGGPAGNLAALGALIPLALPAVRRWGFAPAEDRSGAPPAVGPGERIGFAIGALLLAGAAAAPGGASNSPGTADPLLLVTHIGSSWLGLALLVAAAAALLRDLRGAHGDYRHAGIAAAVVGLLVVVALPGRTATRIGGDFGVMPLKDGAPVSLLLDVGPRAGAVSASAGEGRVRVPFALRREIPGGGLLLAIGLLLLVLAALGYGMAPDLGYAPHALGAAGGVLVAFAAFLVLRPLMGTAPGVEPAALDGWLGAHVLPRLGPGRRILHFEAALPGPYTLGARGAWADLMLLLGGGGLALAVARAHLTGPSSDPMPANGSDAAGLLALRLSLPLQALAALTGSLLASGAWGTAWRGDPIEVGAAVTLGLTGLAATAYRRPPLVAAVTALAAGAAVWLLLAPGRASGGATLHDLLLGP